MDFDIHTLSFLLSLTSLIQVIILSIQYQKQTAYRGFIWWIVGIGLIGVHFFFIFLQKFFYFGFFAIIAENYTLVAAFLALYHGVVRFFNRSRKPNHSIYFLIIFVGSTVASYAFGNIIIPNVVSSLTIALLTALILISLIQERVALVPALNGIIVFSLIVNALFFVAHAILWVILPAPSPQEIPTAMQQISYLLIYTLASLWTFGFIFLLNKRMTQDTVESKEIYNLMFETIPDAVMITRLNDGMIMEVNQGFTKISGYSAAETKGKTTHDLNLWYEPSERSRFVIILTETGSIENMEFQFRRKNGRPIMGLLSARRIEMNSVPHVLSVIRDITSRKKMEDKLRENEQKYRFLTENSGDVIWHINRSYRIDYISPADEQIRGFKREEVIGTQIWPVFKPEGVQLIRQKIEHHQEVEQVGNNTQITRFEIEQRCKDGRWIWTEIVAAPHYDKFGNLIGYHGISRDITERKQLVDQLYQQATIDELTQVPNRRHFMDLAEVELRKAKRYHHPMSIVAIDFDALKEINDTYGHLAGDRALSVFSRIVQQIIREVDVLGRFGGDEFLILLPETDNEQANLVMDRILDVLSTSPVYYGDKSFMIPISAGIASLEDWTDTLEELIDRADEALYESKESGGNQITSHRPDS